MSHKISQERYDGILFLPIILEAWRLIETNTQVWGVQAGEGPPSRVRYRLYFHLGSSLQSVQGHAPTACTVPFGQISAAAQLHQSSEGVSSSAIGTWWGGPFSKGDQSVDYNIRRPQTGIYVFFFSLSSEVWEFSMPDYGTVCGVICHGQLCSFFTIFVSNWYSFQDINTVFLPWQTTNLQ